MTRVEPRVSVILFGQCGLRALELTLDSLLGQTEPAFELLADVTVLGPYGAALLARYGDPRFVTVPNAEAAIAGIRGPIACLTAGDICLPTRFARQLASLENNLGSSVSVCGVTEFDGDTLHPRESEDATLAIAAGRFPPISSLMLAARVLLPGAIPGDEAALCRAAYRAGRAVNVAERLVVRRIEPAVEAPIPPDRAAVTVSSTRFVPADLDQDRPPTLHVVVDTEAEFDWSQPFARELTSVSALAELHRAQSIFDRYGLRPVYLIDYPVAVQLEGVAAIRAIAARDGCAVGAHLHPWTNPPFSEEVSRRFSYPGNLERASEAAKLDTLMHAIAKNFGEATPFYKAGRYGLGPNTISLIAERGARVDFSLLPESDMRPDQGPDFREVRAIPYSVDGTGVVSLPMTRGHVGPLADFSPLVSWLDSRVARSVSARGALARLGLVQRLTLTPEGMQTAQQIRLMRAMLARRQFVFVLHFHSPSLAPGHTPYVRTEAERDAFVVRIEAVCRWFFETLGGLPGRPWDLLPVSERSRYALTREEGSKARGFAPSTPIGAYWPQRSPEAEPLAFLSSFLGSVKNAG